MLTLAVFFLGVSFCWNLERTTQRHLLLLVCQVLLNHELLQYARQAGQVRKTGVPQDASKKCRDFLHDQNSHWLGC